MSTSSAGATVERVCLNLRVSKSVKEAYETVVAEKYGRKRPYTGTELEREFRLALDKGTITELYDSVLDLADAFGKVPREKNNLSTPDDETAVVAYRVAEPVRNGIMALASSNNCSNPGEFVERVMYSYAVGESVDERLINLTDRIKQATDHKFNDELSAKERRTKAIADELDGLHQFTIDDFDSAVESVPKISPGSYIREEYLPRVLDELDKTWHPHNPEVFTNTDDVPPERERDHRNKPYLLMDAADKQLAIKTDIVTGNGRAYTVSDALDALRNKPQHKTVRKLMRQIGETAGFEYKKGSQRRGNNADDVLVVNRKDVLSSTDHKDVQRVLADEQTDDDGSTSADERTETDGTQWVQQAAENLPDAPVGKLPDAVIKNKIAEATNDEIDRDESGSIPDELLDAVTDEQVAKVRQYIADGTEKPGSNPSEGRGRTAGTTVQQPTTSARQLRADGGNPTT